MRIIMLALEGKKHKDLIIMIMALGDAYLEKGLYKDAAKRYHQLLDFKVANGKIFTNLSKAYIGLKRVDKFAQYVYQKAIQYDPSNTEIYDILTTTFLHEGRKDPRAIEIYELALKYDPPNFDKIVDHLGAIY
ncbi:MAG: hypothetical protein ACE5HI_05100, partial [bacterium]